MTAFTQKDLKVLEYYADQGNRELYWNYLAQLPGNDGYGVLALGVVRNDNMPGKVANAFADRYAREHSGIRLSESGWEEFGVDLIRKDVRWRAHYFEKGLVDQALNLPAKDVQKAHDAAFNNKRIDPDAWTPRQLLEAARRQGSEHDVENVWSMMLDNHALGTQRAVNTLEAALHRYNDAQLDATRYVSDMSRAWFDSADAQPNTDPDTIHKNGFDYEYDRTTQRWTARHTDTPPQPAAAMSTITVQRTVSAPALIAELDQTRALRLHRQELALAHHADDPGQRIETPKTLAEQHKPAIEAFASTPPKASDPPLYADLRLRMPAEVSDAQVAHASAQAMRAGIRHPMCVGEVELDERRAIIRGKSHETVFLDFNREPPPREESFQAMKIEEASFAAKESLAMQHSREMSRAIRGPSMSR